MALSFEGTGKKILVLDFDLRKSNETKTIVSDKALIDYLSDTTIDIDFIISKTNHENIDYIAAGNMAQISASPEIIDTLELLKTKYDYVIVDTPALSSVSDAQTISFLADGTILVLEPGEVSEDEFEFMLSKLKQAKSNILGVVFNKLNKSEYKKYQSHYDYFDKYKRASLKMKKKRMRRR